MIPQAGNSHGDFHLEVFSDSTIVVNRLLGNTRKANGKMKRREAANRMANCAERCLRNIRKFASFNAFWNGRINNVKRFGH